MREFLAAFVRVPSLALILPACLILGLYMAEQTVQLNLNVESSNSVAKEKIPETLGSLFPIVPSVQDTHKRKHMEKIERCGTRLLSLAKMSGPGTDALINLYHKASLIKDKEFMQYVMAVIYVESTFRNNVISPANAHGLMQMTPIAVREAERYCQLPEIDSMDQMLDPYTNVKYGTCYLSYTLGQTENNWEHSLIMYNGGKKQLDNYLSSRSMASETVEYVKKVNSALTFCKEGIPEHG